MYAIVDIAGKQFKVSKDQSLFTPSLEGKEGDKVEFDNVLLLDNKGKVNVGSPTIKGAKVSGKIIEHGKEDKIIVFKKKILGLNSSMLLPICCRSQRVRGLHF